MRAPLLPDGYLLRHAALPETSRSPGAPHPSTLNPGMPLAAVIKARACIRQVGRLGNLRYITAGHEEGTPQQKLDRSVLPCCTRRRHAAIPRVYIPTPGFIIALPGDLLPNMLLACAVCPQFDRGQLVAPLNQTSL